MKDNEKFRRAFIPVKSIPVSLTQGDLDRIEAYMDRTNREPGGEDTPYVIGDDKELEITLGALIAHALELAEANYGLRGTVWGEMFSEDVAQHTLKRDGTL
jgi:hypothetical protein